MGKGDKKTKRGKIAKGTHGNSRPSSPAKAPVAAKKETPAKKAK